MTKPGEIDVDIKHALRTIAAGGEALRVANVTNKHKKQLEERCNTMIELLSDELEAIIPKNNPFFMPVLMAAVLRKLTRSQEAQQESEYKSELDHFPPGW